MIMEQLKWTNVIWQLVEEGLQSKSEEELNKLLYVEEH